MKSKINYIKHIFLLLTIISTSTPTLAYKATDFNWRPPFTSTSDKPSVTIIFDNSRKMNRPAYANISLAGGPKETIGEMYNSKKEYYGYFNSNLYYKYNNSTNPQHFYAVDEPDTETFYGNFLNWATMHKLDVAKKILTGGLYENGYYKVMPSTIDTSQDSYWTIYIDYLLGSTDLDGNIHSPIPATYPSKDLELFQLRDTTNLRIRYKSGGKDIDSLYNLYIKSSTPKEGVLHKFETKANFALFWFVDLKTGNPGNEHAGGELKVPMSSSSTPDIIETIDELVPTSTSTTLGETLLSVAGYINNNHYPDLVFPDGDMPVGTYYPSSDPFLPTWCTQQNVIIITGGESTHDNISPSKTFDYPSKSNPYPVLKNVDPYIPQFFENGGSTDIITASYFVHTQDLRPDLGGLQSINIFTVFAFGKSSSLLKHASIWGGFQDKDGTYSPARPSPDLLAEGKLGYDKIPYSDEYNTDGYVGTIPSNATKNEVNPDNYFEAETGADLEKAITEAFEAATRAIMSGTAAAVTSQTRSGEGAVYQALFFPPSNATSFAPPWTGQVHALLVDTEGKMHEDTPDANNIQNGILDDSDKYIEYNGTDVYRYSKGDATKQTISTQDINFLWSSSPWLNSISNSTITKNRQYNNYLAGDKTRHIITFADANNNMIADTNEQQEFAWNSSQSIKNKSHFSSYLTLFESDSGKLGYPTDNSLRDDDDVMPILAQRQINFIRGQDQPEKSFVINSKTVPDPMRSRTLGNGTTWRLGDIVYSSPTIVGTPTENYHILYRDSTYRDFYNYYKNRRQVVYVGANDGMIHAFNGGFYKSKSEGFSLSHNGTQTTFPLGMELWSYIPYNLLPHLKWLTDPDYGGKLHVPYMDLKPKIFDARVFSATSSSGIYHPQGWGTLLVAGMRFGGGMIQSDPLKNGSDIRTMTSAYVILDITDPEQPPKVLAELTMPNQGFTTCYPTVLPMATANTMDPSNSTNQWYLVFGSGPADENGDATTIPNDYRNPAISKQNGHLYVIDLKELVAGKVYSLDENNNKAKTAGAHIFKTTESLSFIGDPVSTDLDYGSYNTQKEFKTDFVYYGTISGNETNPAGTLRRITTYNNQTTSSWDDAVVIDVAKPVYAAPNISIDETDQLWVYFGAGRFFNRGDIPQTQHMSFYGVKDPVYNGTLVQNTPSPVITSELYDSTHVTLNGDDCPSGSYDRKCVKVYKSGQLIGDWDTFITEISPYKGWRNDFIPNWERVLGQSAVFGGAVVFTSYTPDDDICIPEGTSNLYALYYKTGTSYYLPILNGKFDKYISLEKGLAITPSIHVGEDGSTAYVQTSTGAILTFKIETPIKVNPGVLFWRKNLN
ncbi:pilus assembly protein [Desulfomicrobium escambiense]|uniref:pilus assembly protein n=1 Tax=Desulfomicrobium escambiense TaxID=29503 RepID=UPI00040329C6|nr:PilC/PilY family type IV pilus protein [Desulfomicrobium escambiense]